MSIKELLNELKKCANDLENIDINDAINNNEELLNKLAELKKLYNNIINITDEFSDDAFNAMNILTNLAMNNPSLDEWLAKIISINEENDDYFDESFISDRETLIEEIKSLIYEINSTKSRDYEYIQFLKSQLQDNQRLLMMNKDSFDLEEYQRLMNDINNSINQIEQLYSLIKPKKMIRALSI